MDSAQCVADQNTICQIKGGYKCVPQKRKGRPESRRPVLMTASRRTPALSTTQSPCAPCN
jgi:hypothetical protein